MAERAGSDGITGAAEEETIVGMLQRVLHPRLKSMLSESNLAVRQVRGNAHACIVSRWQPWVGVV